MLNRLAVAGLHELCSKAMGSSELCKLLAERFDNQCDEQFIQQIEALLKQFEQLGLVENVSPEAE